MARNHSPKNRTLGITLIETLCVLAILVVLFGQALPSLTDMRQNQLLRNTLQTVETDINHARSLAQTTDQNIRLSLQVHPAGGSCTVVHTGPAHACRCNGQGQAVCTGNAQVFALSEQPAATGVSLVLPERSLVFDAGRGTVSPTATLVISDARGHSVRQIINIMGRTRNCSSSGLSAYPACV